MNSKSEQAILQVRIDKKLYDLGRGDPIRAALGEAELLWEHACQRSGADIEIFNDPSIVEIRLTIEGVRRG